jgi:LasA protease
MPKSVIVCGCMSIFALVLVACQPSAEPIVITATFPAPSFDNPEVSATLPAIEQPQAMNTPTTVQSVALASDLNYVVQPGDTLSGIAIANGITVELLIALNQIENPNLLSVGQVLQLPAPPTEFTPARQLLSNVRFVRSAPAIGFDVATFVNEQSGYIRTATDEVSQGLATGFRIQRNLTASEVIERVSREHSVDPRLLIALLEYKAGWLSRTDLTAAEIRFPMGEVEENREGLYRQLVWAADRLNRAYYGWRYDGLEIIQFSSGERLLYEPSLNGGTVALQYFLSLNQSYESWQREMATGELLQVYDSLFGNPLSDATVVVPDALRQPELLLPFGSNETWFYTGGPHGGWGSGSAWAAIDLAPPDDRAPTDPACYTSQFPIRAVAAGVIARSGEGSIILDLDGDGFEETGWTILYLHIDSAGSVQRGQAVQAGDPLGFPSCEGGFSNATHLHIARRYNGEWIPADCHTCPDGRVIAPFSMGGWSVDGIPAQEYQGFMVRGGVEMRAEQGRLVTYNRINW